MSSDLSERNELLETALDRIKHQVQAVLDRQTDANELKRTLEKVAGRVAALDRLSDHFDEALVTTQEEFERQVLQLRVKQSALESRIEQLEADVATTRNALRIAITGPRVFVVEEAATPSEEPKEQEQRPTRWDRRVSE